MPRTAERFEVVAARLAAAPEELRAARALLCEAERSRAERFHYERDRRRFIVARARLRELLGERLGVRPQAVEFAYGGNGKPRLAPRFARSGWRFSVSRCDELALFALSRAGDVGVDVEALRAVRAADAIATQFFSRREIEIYATLPPRERPLAFLRCWTRKEAFVKALGEGLAVPLDQFDVSLSPHEPARILRIGTQRGDGGWRLHSFSPLRGFVAAVAVHYN